MEFDESADVTVAQALLHMLGIEGVTHLFGIPGGALLSILDELKTQDGTFTYCVCRQETGAAYIADGYARVSGSLGVVVVTSGPGATNALTGSMNAHAAHVPLLTITGEVNQEYFGRGYLQEGIDAALDVAGVYRNAVGWSEIVSSESDFLTLITSALRAAKEARPQAVHLSIPNNIAGATIPDAKLPRRATTYRASSAFVDAAGVRAAVDAIAGARRPLIMLGNSCRRPLEDSGLASRFTKAVETLGVPVMTSANAKGIFPESHFWSLRNYGMAACEWPKHYLKDDGGRQFDCLVVIGSDLGELATNKWDPILIPADTFIQIDNNQAILGRAFPITRGVVGDIEAVLDVFADTATSAKPDPQAVEARRELIESIKRSSPFADPGLRDSDRDPIAPPALMKVINDTLARHGGDAHVFVDAGNCVGWSLNYLEIDPPTRLHLALAMGPMGFGVGSVIGGKLADPEAICMAIVGDGAMMMQAGEIATAAQYGAGAIWVVLADHDLAMVSQGMAYFTKDPTFEHYYTLDWNDLTIMAQGLGAQTHQVRNVKEAEAALDAAIRQSREGVPQLISVTIDESLMPPYYPPQHDPVKPQVRFAW